MSSLPLCHIKHPQTMSQISAQVFDGDILLFTPTPMHDLLKKVENIAKESFSCDYPPHAHRHHTHAEFLRCAETAQQRVNSAECKPLFAEVLAAVGQDTSDLFWDTLGLRIAPPLHTTDDFNNRGFRSHAVVHRDTWGVGLQSQINWWAPVFSLADRRTMGFFPSYWQRPLPNTTDTWSFKEFLASRKQSGGGRAAKYPGAPLALAKPDEKIVPLRMNPGELAAFSSAHLHGSIANTTPLTRFSLEIRTLSLVDLHNQNGAPNADNESVRQPLVGLFSSVADATPLKYHWQPQQNPTQIT